MDNIIEDFGNVGSSVQPTISRGDGQINYTSGIYLTVGCNPNDPRQRFYAVEGSLTGYRFELGQYQGYTRENCLTNAHHPKSGEIIEFHICEEARKHHDETSYWEKF